MQYKFNRVFINNFSLFYRRKEIAKAFAKCKHTCHRIERKLTRTENTVTALCEKVWGLLSEAEYNNVEVYISFLRKKLRALHSEVQIKSIRNAGYHLEVQP